MSSLPGILRILTTNAEQQLFGTPLNSYFWWFIGNKFGYSIFDSFFISFGKRKGFYHKIWKPVEWVSKYLYFCCRGEARGWRSVAVRRVKILKTEECETWGRELKIGKKLIKRGFHDTNTIYFNCRSLSQWFLLKTFSLYILFNIWHKSLWYLSDVNHYDIYLT